MKRNLRMDYILVVTVKSIFSNIIIARVTNELNLALQVSLNKCRILLKTFEQLSIDNLTLMNSCIGYAEYFGVKCTTISE